MKITHTRLKDSLQFSIEDETNHLGVKFTTTDFTTDAGIEKILSTIAEYVSANYTCLHQKHDRGITFAK